MISPAYFAHRWSWYQPILNRGEDPAGRCNVDVRRLPLRVPGEDAGEYIPYAVHSEVVQALSVSLRRLQEYAIQYMVKREKVSAHQLPTMNALSRTMAKHLREQYPHLPFHLLHHWCADEKGALALLQVWQDMWRKGWKQDQADVAPWVPAVNVLLLKLMREAMTGLPDEEAATTDHVMLCVVGGLYSWALQEFLKQHLEGTVEVTRIATYESMMLPATPIAFLYRQPEESLLFDDRHVIRAYGLEPDIVPRMRDLRVKLGPKNEAGMLGLLGKDRQGVHMLRRSWARLALWELAEKSRNGAWMQWVLDAKKLDQLLSKPEQLDEALVRSMQPFREQAFAGWFLGQIEGGRAARKAGEPWLFDDRTLMAFRVFDEDVRVEIARRKAERSWLDRRPSLAGKGRGAEADKALEEAYKEGQIVFLQPGADRSLHSGTSLAAKQGCLRIEWSDYLAGMGALHGTASGAFLSQTFLPGVVSIVEGRENLFMDECSASGCLLRGAVFDLLELGIALRRQFREWHRDISESTEETNMPAVSMCMALIGDWVSTEVQHSQLGDQKIAFGLSIPQAAAGVSRDCGVGRLIAYRDHKSRRQPLGGVRVEGLDTGAGQTVQVLYNNGFALTAPVMAELTSVLRDKASIREYRLDRKQSKSVLGEFRLPGGEFDLISVQARGEENAPLLFVQAGRPCLGGVDVELFELLDPESRAAKLIVREGLPSWSA
ncbi:MAG: hypothetical protein ACE5F3_01400 [Mariprofundaceae bacterium]